MNVTRMCSLITSVAGRRAPILAIPLACFASAAVAETSPPTRCNSNGDLTGIALSPDVLCDYPHGAPLDAVHLARFAWSNFIALNWPARDPFVPPYERGVPSGQWGQTEPAVVWNSWREKRELYRVERRNGKFANVAPPAWNDGKPPSTTGPNPDIKACDDADSAPNAHVTALQSNKVENYLDETDEIGLAVLWRSDTPDPTEDSLVRYQVKFDYDYYHHVRTEKWWDPPTLQAAIKKAPNGFTVILPAGDNAAQKTGTILTKSAWMKLGPGDDPSRFFTRPALYYKTKDKEPCYAYGTFGMIALHIIRKTSKFPYYFFSTFEHVENYPGKFLYANTNPIGNIRGRGVFISTLPNVFGIPYRDPPNPKPTWRDPTSPAYPVNRLVQAVPGVAQVNAEAMAVNRNTIWANYQLVGFQYKPVEAKFRSPKPYYDKGSPPPAGNGYHPIYYEDQQYYLANPVVESNQRFQFFEGQLVQSNYFNVNIYKDNNPTQKLSYRVLMGGCMGCHGNAQMGGTDFSFTLGGAKSAPTQFTAETLEDKCEEIYRKFDAAAGACR